MDVLEDPLSPENQKLLLLAGTIGIGAIAAASVFCCSNSSASTPKPSTPSEEPEEAPVRQAPKKKSSKSKKKKSTPTPPPPEPTPEPTPAAQPPSKSSKKQKQKPQPPQPQPEPEEESAPSTPPAPEQPAPKTQQTSSKNKKKNKKKGAAAAATTTAEQKEAEAPSVQPASSAEMEEAGDDWVAVKKTRSKPSGPGKRARPQTSADEVPSPTTSVEDQEPPAPEAPSLDLDKYVSFVIGKGGKTIKAIQEETGCRLKIGQETAKCFFEGTDEQVEAAMAKVSEIVERERELEEKTRVEEVEVGDRVPAVIGKKGANIRKIATESGAELQVNRPENTITVTGDAEQVAKAKELIALYMAGGPPPEVTEEVELGSRRGRFIVLGEKGATIKAIQDETGAKLTLEANSTFVLVEGDADQVQMACAQLRQLLDENSFQIRFSTQGSIPAVIGKGGATIRSIRDKTGASVDAIGDDVKLTGTKQQVAEAKAMIDSIIASELAPAWTKLKDGQVCEDVHLPKTAVGMVIGKDGMMIRDIKNESGVQIAVNRIEGSIDSTAKIWGSVEGVAKAKSMIDEIMERHDKLQERRKQKEAEAPASSDAAEPAEGNINFLGEEDDVEDANGWAGGDDSEAAPGW